MVKAWVSHEGNDGGTPGFLCARRAVKRDVAAWSAAGVRGQVRVDGVVMSLAPGIVFRRRGLCVGRGPDVTNKCLAPV